MFNDLLDRLEKVGLQVFAYADDLAIVGKYNVRLIEATEIIENWTKENKMIINKKKSGIMFIKKKDQTKLPQSEVISGYPIV